MSHHPSSPCLKSHPKRLLRAPTALALLLLGACGPAETVEPEPVRCDASAVRCTEKSIDKFPLLTVASTVAPVEEGTVSGEFITYVDARAGGATAKESFLYARFTPQGLVKVAVDDQAALASTEWDIAFRRYIIRVNSGVSGPSCTSVAQTPAGTTFDALKAVDTSWEFRPESYYTEACEFVPDDSGIGAPAAQLGSYWTYKGCLAMTNKVFVVRLADGKHVKLQVMRYYDQTELQRSCDSGTASAVSGAAQLRVKWAFLP